MLVSGEEFSHYKGICFLTLTVPHLLIAAQSVDSVCQVEGKNVLIFSISIFNPSAGGNKGSVKVGD